MLIFSSCLLFLISQQEQWMLRLRQLALVFYGDFEASQQALPPSSTTPCLDHINHQFSA
jgi:hypothetical protein